MLEYLFQEQSPFEYTGERNAFLDPLATQQAGHDVYMLSANATFTAPMAEETGYARVWNKNTKTWVQMEDHRGVTYWLPGELHGSAGHVMNELGALPEGAVTTEPEENREQKLAKLLPAVQQALNAFAQTRGYDGIAVACSYASSTNSIYKSEGLYCVQLRDETWLDANSKYAELEQGTGDVPEPAEFVATLPVADAEWPVLNEQVV